MEAGIDRPSRVPLPGPLASARDRPWPLLGREAELDAIGAAWSRVEAGERETLLIAGEPGAGKSRLAAEVGHDAHRSWRRSATSTVTPPAAPSSARCATLTVQLPGLTYVLQLDSQYSMPEDCTSQTTRQGTLVKQ